MNRQDKKLVKEIFKGCLTILAIILASRFSSGVLLIVVALVAINSAFSGKLATPLMVYCLLPFMTIMNNLILPKTIFAVFVLRLAPLAIALGLIITSAGRRGRDSLPVGMLWPYLLVACISSATGYCPSVSYMKIINFGMLLAGVHLGLRNINARPAELERVRMFVLSLIFFLVVGSLATVPFPGIAYSTSLNGFDEEDGLDVANEMIERHSGMLLFAGITNQSQALGIMLPCALAWLLCDMLFVEQRVTPIHVIAIGAAFPMLYMCHSRTAFVAACTAIVVVLGYCMKRVSIPPRVRKALKSAVYVGVASVIGLAIVMEVRNNAISKFLRKSETVDDGRTLTEAFTSSRMGMIERNMVDFRRNPMFGMGFQVMERTRRLSGRFVLSAPIEKSVLPVMVLGETGIVGGFVFVMFLLVFYSTCIRKRYLCTIAMMTTFLATNMSEATYFSPGGAGGVMWVFCGAGGFVSDMIIQNRRRFVFPNCEL